MVARTSEEQQRKRRRKRLLQGLLLGGAAVGIPALANVLVARRSRALGSARWGAARRYAWDLGEVSFQKLGEGPPTVLLHSFGPGHDSEEWRDTAELLAASREILAMDFLGWGRSERPRIAYDGEIYIRQVVDFIEDVARQRVDLVAAGLSAAYAVQVAADRPELVRSLNLVGPTGIEYHEDEPDLKDALTHRLLRVPVLGTSALNVYTSRTALASYLKREIFAAPERVDAALVEHHYRSSHQQGAHASLAALLAGYLNHSVDEALPLVQAPFSISWGTRAANAPVQTADLWIRRAPVAELLVFEDAGALPHAETPTAFCRELEAFLGRLPG